MCDWHTFNKCNLLACLGTEPAVQMMLAESGATYLQISLLYWGNVNHVTIQCDDLDQFRVHINSGTTEPYRVCLDTVPVSWCSVEIRPEGCVEEHAVYKQWNVSVIPGLVIFVFRFIFMIIYC